MIDLQKHNSVLENTTSVYVTCEQVWGRVEQKRITDGDVIYRVSGVEGEFTRDELITDLEFNSAMLNSLQQTLIEHESKEPIGDELRLGHWWSRRNQILESINHYRHWVQVLSQS